MVDFVDEQYLGRPLPAGPDLAVGRFIVEDHSDENAVFVIFNTNGIRSPSLSDLWWCGTVIELPVLARLQPFFPSVLVELAVEFLLRNRLALMIWRFSHGKQPRDLETVGPISLRRD